MNWRRPSQIVAGTLTHTAAGLYGLSGRFLH